MNLRGRNLSALYQQRFDGLGTYRLEVWQRIVRDFFEPRFMHSIDSLLDLGAGHGEFILNANVPNRIAMDMSPDIEAIAQQAGIEVLRQDCTDVWPIPPNSIDLIFSSNLLEHLPSKDSIHTALLHSFRSLKPGGRVIFMGPNIRIVRGAYWDFWDHHIPLTERSLIEILRLIGFEIISTVPRFLPYTMSDRRAKPLWLLSLYLKVPLMWRVFGKQFLIVGEKPRSP